MGVTCLNVFVDENNLRNVKESSDSFLIPWTDPDSSESERGKKSAGGTDACKKYNVTKLAYQKARLPFLNADRNERTPHPSHLNECIQN